MEKHIVANEATCTTAWKEVREQRKHERAKSASNDLEESLILTWISRHAHFPSLLVGQLAAHALHIEAGAQLRRTAWNDRVTVWLPAALIRNAKQSLVVRSRLESELATASMNAKVKLFQQQ